MRKETINKLQLIYTPEQMERIRFAESVISDNQVTVDVHGMKCTEAKKFLNNLINLVQESFHLIVIHGYNHGTAIKDMLSNNFENAHVARNYPDQRNQGVTHLVIA
jgi:DNA-nicking Smr family endonuclease